MTEPSSAGYLHFTRERRSVVELLGIVFIVACLNPWTSFGTNDLDSQPWPFFAALIYLLAARRLEVPPSFFLVSLCLVAGLLTSIILSPFASLATTVRAVISYFTFLLVLLGFYTHLIRFGPPYCTIVSVAVVWLLAAMVEMAFPNVIAQLSATRTTPGRGLTSLAPEPTFYALFAIFLSWLFMILKDFSRTSMFAATFYTLLTVVVLSRSTMGVLYIFVGMTLVAAAYGAAVVATAKVSIRVLAYGLLLATAIIVTAYAAINLMADTRLGSLFQLFLDVGPLNVVLSDESISHRAESIVISIHGALVNYLTPGGLDSFSEMKAALSHTWGGLFWSTGVTDKIMSWLGTVIFELGIFGVIAVGYLSYVCTTIGRARIVELVVILVFLLGAIPVAFPLVPMIYAAWLAAPWRSVNHPSRRRMDVNQVRPQW